MTWFYWDPQRVFFTLPGIDISIYWYGFFFSLGFILAYFVLRSMWQEKLLLSHEPSLAKSLSTFLVDRLTWYSVIGTIVGARLGHVLFYDLDYFIEHPLDIFKTRQGGLASHGATIGILVGLYLYHRFVVRKSLPSCSFWEVVDLFVVVTGIGGAFIRIGNFFNQEIMGTPCQMPWAIIFGHPCDGEAPIPRHPVQLYEAAQCLFIFILLYALWKARGALLSPGFLTGSFFVLLFTGRFVLEFFKAPQGGFLDDTFLSMGQWLSIPFIIAGLILCLRGRPSATIELAQ